VITVQKPRRVARVTSRLAGVLCAGLLAAACTSGGPNATPPKIAPSSGHSSTTTTTTTVPTATSLPECGASRDPLDPTGSSGANC
jgi:hypothetical protein